MQKQIIFLLLIISVSVVKADIFLNIKDKINYRCDNAKNILVEYFSLSDNSYYFARISMDNKLHTLLKILSASGINYNNGILDWHIKGNEGILSKRIGDYKYSPIYKCSEVE